MASVIFLGCAPIERCRGRCLLCGSPDRETANASGIGGKSAPGARFGEPRSSGRAVPGLLPYRIESLDHPSTSLAATNHRVVLVVEDP